MFTGRTGMKKNSGLNELIYEYYESRILFGVYRYGEQLLSVPKICASFRLGRNTIQMALDKLEKNGYIETEERKVARVVYQGTEETFRENAAKYFVPRKEGILDFEYAGELLFFPMWKIGVHNLETDIRGNLNENHDTVMDQTVPIPVKLYFEVLRTFHNDLLLNLYWQCLRYLNFLYPKRDMDIPVLAAGETLPETNMQGLKSEFDDYFDSIQNEVLEFIAHAGEAYHLENVRQIPFSWTIYRRRPQVRYTLGSVIIREILWERYPVGSYLPSLPKMAEQYQVSLSTVRRTLDVLHSLGVTRTYMGIGTKVCLEPVGMEVMKISEIRENMRLHGEGMQILAMTVRSVTLFTMESVTKRKREEFLQSITKLRGKTSSILFIDVLLSFISAECPSAIIRECYGKLRELNTWGYILSAVLMGTGQLDADYTGFIDRQEKDLRTDDFDAFAEQWQIFIENRMKFFYSEFPFREE